MYRENEYAFKIAIGQLLNWGTNNAITITDEEIKNAHVSMMTDLIAQTIYRYAREMAKIEDEDYGALIKFCIVEKIYDTKGFKPRKRK